MKYTGHFIPFEQIRADAERRMDELQRQRALQSRDTDATYRAYATVTGLALILDEESQGGPKVHDRPQLATMLRQLAARLEAA